MESAIYIKMVPYICKELKKLAPNFSAFYIIIIHFSIPCPQTDSPLSSQKASHE